MSLFGLPTISGGKTNSWVCSHLNEGQTCKQTLLRLHILILIINEQMMVSGYGAARGGLLPAPAVQRPRDEGPPVTVFVG